MVHLAPFNHLHSPPDPHPHPLSTAPTRHYRTHPPPRSYTPTPIFTPRPSNATKIKAMFTFKLFATNVVIKIPLPKSTANTNFSTASGKCKYEPAQASPSPHSFSPRPASAPTDCSPRRRLLPVQLSLPLHCLFA